MLAEQALPRVTGINARPVQSAKAPTDMALLARMADGDRLAMRA